MVGLRFLMMVLLNIYSFSPIPFFLIASPNIIDKRIPYIPDAIQNCNAIRFLLLSKQHSGTHFFSSIINQHPYIIMRGKECGNLIANNYKQCLSYSLPYSLGFHYNLRLQIFNAYHVNEKELQFRNFPVDYWSKHEYKYKNNNLKAIGFILQLNQGWNRNEFIIFNNHLRQYFKQEIKFILLHRKNYIAQSFSNSGLMINSSYGILKHEKVIINMLLIEQDLNLTEKVYSNQLKLLSENHFQWIYIIYEHLVNNNADIFINIFKFLGIHDLDNISYDEDSSVKNTILTNKDYTIYINSSTEYHNETTLEYISNIREVIYYINNHHDKFDMCMLLDDCQYHSKYCKDVKKCF